MMVATSWMWPPSFTECNNQQSKCELFIVETVSCIPSTVFREQCSENSVLSTVFVVVGATTTTTTTTTTERQQAPRNNDHETTRRPSMSGARYKCKWISQCLLVVTRSFLLSLLKATSWRQSTRWCFCLAGSFIWAPLVCGRTVRSWRASSGFVGWLAGWLVTTSYHNQRNSNHLAWLTTSLWSLSASWVTVCVCVYVSL